MSGGPRPIVDKELVRYGDYMDKWLRFVRVSQGSGR